MSPRSDWYSEINNARNGAGYFYQLRGARPLRFRAEDYLVFRSLRRDQSSCLLEEWNQWILDLRESRHEHVRRAAVGATALTQKVLDMYYQTQIASSRKLDLLESSSRQHRIADDQLTSLLQEGKLFSLVSLICSTQPSLQ